MKQRKNNKIILVWLLAAVFVMPFIGRAVHACETECGEISCTHSENDGKAGHDCQTCAVCQFVLSSFTEANNFNIDLIPTEFRTRMYIRYQEKGYNTTCLTNQLRAPPAIA